MISSSAKEFAYVGSWIVGWAVAIVAVLAVLGGVIHNYDYRDKALAAEVEIEKSIGCARLEAIERRIEKIERMLK